jgi:hypothetical protein
MCAQEVHTYARMKKISETMLLYNVIHSYINTYIRVSRNSD